jgi:hypothetical protein
MGLTEVAKRLTPHIVKRGITLTQGYLRSMSLARRDNFVTIAPSPQTAIDAAPDIWVSRFPDPLSDVHAGDAELFSDNRISWAFDRLGGVDGKTVIDLGPLEGAHSYMAQVAGASRVVGVEGNKAAYIKCLITKGLLNLDRCSFVCGDAIQYLETTPTRFDLCIACGILYHMTEPVRLIDLIGGSARRLTIWTHVYHEQALQNKGLAEKLSSQQEAVYKGFYHHVYRHDYNYGRRLAGFYGGTSTYSNWLSRDDLLRALEHFGWTNIEVAFDDLSHPNGPALALVATREDIDH